MISRIVFFTFILCALCPLHAMRIGGVELTEEEAEELLRKDPDHAELAALQKGHCNVLTSLKEEDVNIYLDSLYRIAASYMENILSLYPEKPTYTVAGDRLYLKVQNAWDSHMARSRMPFATILFPFSSGLGAPSVFFDGVIAEEYKAMQLGSVWAYLHLRYQYEQALRYSWVFCSKEIDVINSFLARLGNENALMHRVIKDDKAVWQNRWINDPLAVEAPLIFGMD